MIKIQVDISRDITAELIAHSVQIPSLMRTAVRRNTSRLISRMLAELKREPGPPAYPIKWASERQRKFVMAKLRRENNLPYKRTHHLSQSWEANFTIDNDGGVFQVGNADPSAIYVQGDLAQPFHIDRWPQAAPIISKYFDQLEDVLIDTWFTVTSPGL